MPTRAVGERRNQVDISPVTCSRAGRSARLCGNLPISPRAITANSESPPSRTGARRVRTLELIVGLIATRIDSHASPSVDWIVAASASEMLRAPPRSGGVDYRDYAGLDRHVVATRLVVSNAPDCLLHS